jgi:hypothetical protein
MPAQAWPGPLPAHGAHQPHHGAPLAHALRQLPRRPQVHTRPLPPHPFRPASVRPPRAPRAPLAALLRRASRARLEPRRQHAHPATPPLVAAVVVAAGTAANGGGRGVQGNLQRAAGQSE